MIRVQIARISVSIVLLLAAGCSHPEPDTEWRNYGGNKAGNRYSLLSQINRSNVQSLRPAWIYHSAGDVGKNGNEGQASGQEIQCQPIVVHGLLYGLDPALKLFALDAATGKERWKFDPFSELTPRYTRSRGMTYWEDGKDRRIFFTAGSGLYALDAATGKPIPGFAEAGRLSLHTGLGINHDVANLYVAATSPAIIYRNILIIGSAVSEAGNAAPGYVRGFDVRTGKLLWTFHTIPQPGEPGYETWPQDAYQWAGGANNWGGMALDEKRGLVYFGTGSPSSDFYGGGRAGSNLYANCILALQAQTGKLKWYYQTIHHDLWDRDIPCPPNLTSIVRNGKKEDVLVQSTKDGLVYVLDRDDGHSVFPVEEKPVPTAGLPGEHPWPVQKFPLKPAQLCNQFMTDSEITNISQEAHDYVERIFSGTDHGEKFFPPSEKGTVLVGYSGGAEWGGNAVDSSGTFYQNSNNAPWLLRMISRKDQQREVAAISRGNGLYISNCASCHGADRKGNGQEVPELLHVRTRLPEAEIARVLKTGQGRMPSFQTLPEADRQAVINFLESDMHGVRRVAAEHREGTKARADQKKPEPVFPYRPPYLSRVWEKLTDSNGYPGIKPPWGTLSAIDLNTGEYKWRVPLGEFPELTKKGIPVTGMESYGGPLATAGGLIFIAGTRDEKIRAFDSHTGEQVWEYRLPAAGFATPITYRLGGIQYIVIAAGGGRGLKTGGDYVAFALPQ
jgi:quinoprotein glucose dehydrogenase